MPSDGHGNVKYPPYTEMPSLAHELAVMFGFIGLCVLIIVVYWFSWQASNRRADAAEADRRARLNARGINEKGVASHDDRVTSSSQTGHTNTYGDGFGVVGTAYRDASELL